jgi:S-adenosylmethionine:tRNA ribosyltransferase-isomerase
MKLSDFDYHLPKELIGQYPLQDRDAARLLVLNREKSTIEHRVFKDIKEYFNKGDLLVLNDTRVLPSRLIGKRLTGGRVEVLLLNRRDAFSFNALIRPARIKLGEKIKFNGDKLSAVLTSRNELTFSSDNIDAIYRLGTMPLPPYIKRQPEDLDRWYYQTVYAKNDGSIAAPTAGLHFTKELIAQLESGGINIAYITLHIGYSTFKPVKSDHVREHRMDQEPFSVSDKAFNLIKNAQSNNHRIIAVGTTSCRVLETSSLRDQEGYTDLFIYPGYKFIVVDCLLTNFHLPRTTLYMLVCAFAGTGLIKKAYQEAIERKYRFYSYGDAMLLI